MGLAPVTVLMLAPQDGGEHVVAHADDDVQASAEVLIPQEAHGPEEEPLLRTATSTSVRWHTPRRPNR